MVSDLVNFGTASHLRLSIKLLSIGNLPYPFMAYTQPASNFSIGYWPYSITTSEDISSTQGAHALSCWPLIIHSYCLSIPHFPFGTRFHIICSPHFCSISFSFNSGSRFSSKCLNSPVHLGSFSHCLPRPNRQSYGLVHGFPCLLVIALLFTALSCSCILIMSISSCR